MIAATRPRASCDLGSERDLRCPSCRSPLSEDDGRFRCDVCDCEFPTVAGIRDLRVAPDRYLSLRDERAKAERLAELSVSQSFAELCRSYYEMTRDVDEKRASRYLSHLASAEERAEAFVEFLPKYGRVLEIGCGTGGMLSVAARNDIDIEGVDIALRWLILCKKRLEPITPQIKLTAANAESLPWAEKTFSGLFADSVLEHLDDPASALREWYRVAKLGASLTIVSPNRFSISPDPHVGLWGLGFLPRSWQVSYVRQRRQCNWPVRPRSAREAAHMLCAAGWRIQSITAAPAPASTNKSAVRTLYEWGRRVPLTARVLRRFGPLWMITATREGSP